MAASIKDTYRRLNDTWDKLIAKEIDVAQANAECNIAAQMDKCVRTQLQIARHLTDVGHRQLPSMGEMLALEHQPNGQTKTNTQ